MLVSLVMVIAVVGVGTYAARALPLVLGSHVALPPAFVRWLSFVTPAVLGALLGPELLLPDGYWTAPWLNATLLAALPTALVAWKSRNLLLTVVAGVVFFAIARLIVR